jgi:D-alanyl-D-alanine carboxypeptidase (penicillin-binding protein 5/6)
MKLNQLNWIKLTVLLILITLVLSVFPITVYGKNEVNDSLQPQTVGKSVILMDIESGRVLYEKNSRQELPPASVTKIMTALLVIENGDLNDEVVISEHAAETPESTVYLEPGEKLTRMELLYACMLPSANDACVALAESVTGSEENFIELMNIRARQLGMKNTHYCNPHGLDDEQHYTTAYDLALLSRHALKNPVFTDITSTPRKVIPWESREEDRLLLNQNRLLYRYEGAYGVKTGFTRQAGNCVVGAAKRGNMNLIAISLNSPAVYDDLINMLDYGFNNFRLVELADTDQLSAEVTVLGGASKTVKAEPAQKVQVAIADNERPYISYKINAVSEISAPVKQGDILGVIKIYKKDEQIGEVNLLASQSVNIKQSLAQSIGIKAEKYSGILILLLLVLGCFNKRISKIYKTILRLIVLIFILIFKLFSGIFNKFTKKHRKSKTWQQAR